MGPLQTDILEDFWHRRGWRIFLRVHIQISNNSWSNYFACGNLSLLAPHLKPLVQPWVYHYVAWCFESKECCGKVCILYHGVHHLQSSYIQYTINCRILNTFNNSALQYARRLNAWVVSTWTSWLECFRFKYWLGD